MTAARLLLAELLQEAEAEVQIRETTANDAQRDLEAALERLGEVLAALRDVNALERTCRSDGA